MGNYNNTLNSYDGFSSLPNNIYFDTYTTEEKYLINDLQHSMLETKDVFNSSPSNFVTIEKPWITRNGLFSYDNSTGENNAAIGSRTILSIK